MIESENCFLLHTRNYTDSRLLVDLLTEHYGRVSGVMRRPKSGKQSGMIQAFTPLLVSWRGKSSLKTVNAVEARGRSFALHAKSLFCGFYINEILQRVLPEEDPCSAVFSLYAKTLEQLSWDVPDEQLQTLESNLRHFELSLLETLGFGVDFTTDLYQHEIIGSSQGWYRFVDGEGFLPVSVEGDACYPAEVLVKIGARDFQDTQTRYYAKRLCRQLLKPLLGSRPLKSRDLFR